ncbi:RNA-associated protein [candidate division MSBL1 archaeon SCGC-AAA261G05]|uniref:RNA-associated protein n=3 Tax=candidate division MSBL1 TaxID=215777 RepID=A0A133V1E9_9EURY|nr:RNA-associated protein [candidate division MSBL1 archaeon SCGC-AAA261C02]KXB04161.1 RNA-associated protein [candidate division MSBL1 archaeon SCGC-AAA261G05]
MVTVEEAVIARLSTHGEDFEVLVDPELVLDYRAGEEVDLREILASEKVFKDSKKGKKASEERMKELFETSDPIKVAEKIIKKGKIQVTTEQRHQMRDQRRKQIISLIARRSIDPQSDRPHPPNRIENALDQTSVQIDPFKSAEEQLSEVVEALRPIIPLKFETRRIAIKIPPKYAGKAYRIVDESAEIKKDEWLDDGSWAVVVEIPAGTQPEFFEKLNNFTQGEVETKVL